MSGDVALPAIFGDDRFAHLDLGDSHWLGFYTTSQAEGRHVGGILYHVKPDGSACFGSIQWAEVPEGRPKWTLVFEDPLTLTPSVLCKLCEDHGFIRDGKWVRV